MIGVESAGSTVRNAALNFPRANLCFVQADARSLPVGNAIIGRRRDLIRDHRAFRSPGRFPGFAECAPGIAARRMFHRQHALTQDVYASPPGTACPIRFHVHEFDRAENSSTFCIDIFAMFR